MDNKRRSSSSPPPPYEDAQHQTFKKFKGDDYIDADQQLVPMISRAETNAVQNIDSADDGESSDEDEEFVDAPEAMSRGTTPARAQSEVIDITDEDDDEDADHESIATEPDLFQSIFMSKSNGANDSGDGDDGDGDDAAAEVNGEEESGHTKGCTPTPNNRRHSTPPVPEPDLIITGSTTAPKEKTTPPPTITNISKAKDTKESGRLRQGADIDRDLYEGLRRHFKFHNRVLKLIPNPNAPDFDWSRRYWIAVLMLDRNPKSAATQRDYVWMKGNRLTTGQTIWHKYLDATMEDKETTVLMLGTERLKMTDTMEECDYFGDRFVLIRAVTEGTERARGKRPLAGLVPREAEAEAVEID